MSNFSHTLESFVDEVLVNSALPTYAVSILRGELVTHLITKTLMVSNHYPEVKEKLYSFNDNKMYSVFSVCFSEDYIYFLLTHDDLQARVAFKEAVKKIKVRYGPGDSQLGELLSKLGLTQITYNELVRTNVKTKRLSTDVNNISNKFVQPSDEELQRYYECERKQAYVSYEQTSQCLKGDNLPYQCKHCKQFHQGREPVGDPVPKPVMRNRWLTIWRREHGV